MTDVQRSRLVELRAELATPDGVIDMLRERSARLLLVCEWGESYLAELAEREGGERAFEAKILQRFVSVVESTRRHLEALARLHNRGDGLGADEVLESVRREQGQRIDQ